VKILMINPNTTAAFTDTVQSVADQYKEPGTEVVAMTPSSGPRSIESVYDELLSSAGTLELLVNELDNFDAFVIACFSDHPTIYAAREITDKPVLGIAEASMYMACMLGYKFSVVTTNAEWEPLLWDAVKHYGLEGRCASVRTTGMAVLALEACNPDDIFAMILDAGKKAVEVDGAEVICLGCAGMAGLDKKLEAELGVPVVDGVVAALKFLEGMTRYGIRTSKRLAYAQPVKKELVNLPAIFEKPYQSEEPSEK
jgi:allantoin racemase